MALALAATGIVILALLGELMLPRIEEAIGHFKARRRIVPADAGFDLDPGRERRAEARARLLLKSCVNDEEWAMYRDLGFIRVWGERAGAPGSGSSRRAAAEHEADLVLDDDLRAGGHYDDELGDARDDGFGDARDGGFGDARDGGFGDARDAMREELGDRERPARRRAWRDVRSGWDARGPRRGRPVSDDTPYAYLIYPHKPILAYVPQTGRLLSEHCVEFPDETRPYGSSRLPDSDDVLAKWMALTGDEARLIATANMHLPGRQIDPRQVKRDLWRLRQWERAHEGASARGRVRAQ